jgi:hypothetical protein
MPLKILCQCFFCYPVVWLFSEGFSSFSVSFEVRASRTRNSFSLSLQLWQRTDARLFRRRPRLTYAFTRTSLNPPIPVFFLRYPTVAPRPKQTL